MVSRSSSEDQWARHRSRSQSRQGSERYSIRSHERRRRRSGWWSGVASFCCQLRDEQTRPKRTSWASTASGYAAGAIGGPRRDLRWPRPRSEKRQTRISRSSSSGSSWTMTGVAHRQSSRRSRSRQSSRWPVSTRRKVASPYRTGPRRNLRARPSSAASSRASRHGRSTVF